MNVDPTEVIDLPHPSDDPDVRYCHEGKEYEVIGQEIRLTVVEYDPDGPAGGIVILEANDENNPLLNEFERSGAGITREAVEGRVPDESHRAVYSVNGLIKAVGQIELAEVDSYSYSDLYYDRLDEIGDVEGDR